MNIKSIVYLIFCLTIVFVGCREKSKKFDYLITYRNQGQKIVYVGISNELLLHGYSLSDSIKLTNAIIATQYQNKGDSVLKIVPKNDAEYAVLYWKKNSYVNWISDTLKIKSVVAPILTANGFKLDTTLDLRKFTGKKIVLGRYWKNYLPYCNDFYRVYSYKLLMGEDTLEVKSNIISEELVSQIRNINKQDTVKLFGIVTKNRDKYISSWSPRLVRIQY